MRASLSIAVAAVTLALAPTVHAANPTVADCLSATETSLKLRTDHKLRAARAQVLTCSAASCPGVVREECARRMDEINAALPSIVFTVKTRAGDELAAVKITMDGEVVATHLDGSALVLDPGSHDFTFQAAGQAPVSKTIILHEGEKNRRQSVTLGDAGAATAAPAAAATPEPSEPPAPVVPPSHAQQIAGIAIGGVGVAGLIVGGVFGGLTFSSWSTAHSECMTNMGCSSQAVSDRNTTVTYGTVSTVGFIAGGALAVAGLTVFLTAPKSTAKTVGLKLAPGGLSVLGSF